MMGLGELYVGACAVYLGASVTLAALITTVPLFLGSCAQVLTPILIDRTGLGLWIYQSHGLEAYGYLTIFSGALLARAASTYYLGRMGEPSYTPRGEETFTLIQFFRRLPHSNFAKFVVFVACLTASAQF